MHVANFHRLDRDSPGIRFLVENALQLMPKRFALRDHLRQFVPPDRFPQRCLGTQRDGVVKSSTSRIAFSAFQTTQKTIASTFTGTVSRVSADSAVTSVTRIR